LDKNTFKPNARSRPQVRAGQSTPPICAARARPRQTKTELNRIIVPIDNDQLSTGVDFKDLKSYQRCPAN